MDFLCCGTGNAEQRLPPWAPSAHSCMGSTKGKLRSASKASHECRYRYYTKRLPCVSGRTVFSFQSCSQIFFTHNQALLPRWTCMALSCIHLHRAEGCMLSTARPSCHADPALYKSYDYHDAHLTSLGWAQAHAVQDHFKNRSLQVCCAVCKCRQHDSPKGPRADLTSRQLLRKVYV